MTYQGQFDCHWEQFREKAAASKLLEERLMRTRFFPRALFAETAWDAMLVLFSHDYSSTLSSAEIAAQLDEPVAITARWLACLEQQGLVESRIDPLDPRRNIVELTSNGRDTLAEYLAAIR